MSYIDSVNVGGSPYKIQETMYIAPTLSGTAYTASLANFTLATGATVQAKFSVTNPAEATLNVNSTGAKNIFYNNAKITANQFKANHTYTLVYDGTQWQLVGDIDTNTQTVTGVKGNSESNYRTGNVNITATNIGLGNVENTALSTWTGSSNIATVGTITSGTWNGTAIANNKLANSSLTVGNKTISLGGTGKLKEIQANPQYHVGDTSNCTYVLVTINKETSWMLSFTLRLYQGYQATDIQISGYNYGGNHWYSPQAVILGSTSSAKFNVYFGYTGNYKLWVAVDGSSYTGASVVDITNGYTQIDFENAITLTKVSALPETLQTTKEIYRPWYRNETVSNATNATTASNATTATTAGAFSSGTTVKLTGDTTGESSSSTKGWTVATTTNALTATSISSLNTQELIDGFLEANKLKYGLFKTSEANNIGMASNDGMLISMCWGSTTYGVQLALDDNPTGIMKFRGKVTNWGDWKTVAHSGNVSTGDSDGQVKIAGTNVSVKGLGALAYKANLAASDIPDLSWNKITSDKPTTLSGYGITDAKIASGVITLGSNTITPVTSVNGHTGSSVSVTASDLGLTSALKYVGTKSSLPTATDSTTYSTYNNGDVITVSNKEYAYVKGSNAAGSSWVELGDEGSYKLKQTAFTNSTGTADGSNTSTTFIYSFSQDANGVITDIKTRKLPTYNNYSHPTGDGNLHVPATGTGNNGKVLKAGSTAGSLSWGTLSASDVGAAPSSTVSCTTANVKSALGTVSTTAKKFLKDTGSWAQVDWGDLTGVPSSFSPSSHTHSYIALYEARASTTTLNKSANYVAAGAVFHLIASSSTSATDNGKTPTDANVLQMNWDNNGGYDAQIAVSTDANRMYFRDRPSSKKAWQEVAHAPVGTSNIGSATQPVYMTSTGVITAGTELGASAYHADSYFALASHGTHVTTATVQSALSISSSGSATKALTEKGTFVTFGTSNLTIGSTSDTAMAGNTVVNKVKTTAKTDNAAYKLLLHANTSPTSGSDYEAVYSVNATFNTQSMLLTLLKTTHTGDQGLILDNTESGKLLKLGYIIGNSGNGGIYDYTHGVWKLKIATDGTTTLAGNADTATTADKLAGFSSRATTMAWGNQTGSVITCFATSGGGGWGFRDNNPVAGQTSMTIDGTIYIKEGAQDIAAAVKSFSVSGQTVTYTNLWGGTGTFTTQDTKNTAGSTDSTSKLYLIGATSQAANPQTYSDAHVFETNGAFSAKTIGVNADTDADKVTLQWNSTDSSLDFIFV